MKRPPNDKHKHSGSVAPTSWFGKYLPGGIVFCFAFLLYANSITNSYNLDDELVTRNHKLTSQGFSGIVQIFSSPYYTDNAGYSYEYRPVVLTTFAIEHQFFGDNPHVSHFFNLLLYALCCVVLFRVLYTIIPGRAQLLSLCITLLFVAFPAHTEAVCSIKSRDEILSLLFGLLTINAAYKAITKEKKGALFMVPVLFLLALLSKTTVISFVFIIPVILIFFTEASLKRILIISIMLLVPAFFVIDIDFTSKLISSFLLIMGLVLVYIVVRSKTRVILQRLEGYKSFFTMQHNHVGDLPALRGFKVLLANIKPDPAVFSFKPALIAFALGGLYFIGVYTVFPSAVVIAALILGGLIIWGKEPFWWWASVALYACLAFAPIKYSWDKTLYGELVAAILLYQIFFGNRQLFIPATAIFIIYTAIGFRLDDLFILENRMFGIIGLRLIGWPALIWQWVPVHNFFKHWQIDTPTLQRALYNIGPGSLITTLLMLSLIFKSGARYLVGVFVVMAIGLMFYFQTVQDRPVSILAAQNKLIGTVNKINPKFIDIKQYRPLDFVEQPVNRNNTISVRVGTALEVMYHYFIKTVVPYPMAFYYGYRFIKPEPITGFEALAGLIIWLLLAVLTLVCIHKSKLLSLGLIIYLLSLTLLSGYFYPVPGQVAERFMLIPTMGWCIALGWGLFVIFRISSKTSIKQWASVSVAPKAVFMVILTLYSVITFARNFDWKDDVTLFRHDIAYVNESVQAQNILATHLIDHSLVTNDPAEQKALREEAIEHFKRAVSIHPEFFNATYDLGRVYLMLNMPDSALVWFIKANNINPDYTEEQYDIADLYAQSGRYKLAVPYLEYAIKNRPEDYTGYNKLSYAYFMLKEPYRSMEVSKQAILKTHAGGIPYVAIGSVYLTLNKPDSAALWAHKALQVEPGNDGAIRLLQHIGAK